MSKAKATRHDILQKAFELVYTHGYQTTSIDDIIATTKVTKGAFYYHFKSKDDMGVAIINEILKPTMQASFIEPMEESEDPVKDIYKMMKHLLLENPFLQVAHGCPVGNITQEMTPWNEDFSKALNELIDLWKQTVIRSLKKAKAKGLINKTVNPEQVAYFIISGYWGIRNFGKLYNNKESYKVYLKELKIYLENLR